MGPASVIDGAGLERYISRITPRSLSVFPGPGELGDGLADDITALARELGYDARIEREYSPRTGIRAMGCDDVVVFDLTISDGDEGSYRALTPHYVFFGHVLLVSRSYLPMNVLPVRTGGAPLYPHPAKSYPDGSPVRYPPITVADTPASDWISEDDRSLLIWLQAQLEDLQRGPVGPRLDRELTYGASFPIRKMMRLVKEIGAQPLTSRAPERVFLSYRGRYYDQALKLAEQAATASIPDAGRKSIRVVAPSEFALERELLSGGRRWMVLSYLRLLIRDAPELWVYRSPDYLGSWWTLSELIMAESLRRAKLAPRLRVFDPDSGTVADDPGEFRVRWHRKERDTVTRFALRTTPGTSISRLKKLPPPLPRAYRGREGWSSFWNDLLIDRRIVEDMETPYEPTGQAFFAGLNQMLQVDEHALRAVEEGETAVSATDGTMLRLASFAPRYLFSRPEALHPDRRVLTRLPTYYALPSRRATSAA